MNSELTKWAEKAVQKCNPIAENYYLDYYAFQKPCNLNSKTLILALNPYDNSSFPTEKVENIIKSQMNVGQFLAGNSDWNGYKTKWKIFKQLSKMKIFDDLQLDFNYMNYVYFPSKRFNDIKKLKEVDILKVCQDLTLEFLDILKPEKIILLGTTSGSDQFNIEGITLLNKNNKRLIVKGKIDEIDVYAIPHPSWLSDEELAAIDINLRQIFNNEIQSNFDFEKSSELIDRDAIELLLKDLSPIRINNNYTDIYLDGKENEKLLIRINYKNKIIGIRNIDKKNYENLKYFDFYKIGFTNIVSEKVNSWAFEKKFPSHFFATNEDITNEIIDLQKRILNNK